MGAGIPKGYHRHCLKFQLVSALLKFQIRSSRCPKSPWLHVWMVKSQLIVILLFVNYGNLYSYYSNWIWYDMFRFMEPLTKGKYPRSMRSLVGRRLPKFSKQQSELLRNASFDFIGLNYYTSTYAAHAPLPQNPSQPAYLADSLANLTCICHFHSLFPFSLDHFLTSLTTDHFFFTFPFTDERNSTPIGSRVYIPTYLPLSPSLHTSLQFNVSHVFYIFIHRLLQIGYIFIQEAFEVCCFTSRESTATLWFILLKMVLIKHMHTHYLLITSFFWGTITVWKLM